MLIRPPLDRRVRQLIGAVLPFVLGLAIAANVAWTVRGLEPSGSVIVVSDSSDLADLMARSQPTTRRWYRLYADIGQLAHGQRLIVSDSIPIDVDLAAALSGVDVQVSDSVPQVIEESIDLPKRGGQWLVGGELERYVMFEGEPGEDYALTLDGRLIVVVPVSAISLEGQSDA